MEKAFLFDLNGTVIDDMEYHLTAWKDILNNDLDAGLTYEQVRKEMYGKNSEVLIRIFGEGKFTPEQMDELSVEKERRYQQMYLPHLKLIDGLGEFFKKSAALKIPMAIGSAAIMFNVDFVLNNLNLQEYFGAIVSADHVDISKPHPETFLKGAEALGVAPENCIVFEDAPKGVEAALNAGMYCVVILSALHTEEEFAQYPNVLHFIRSYNEIEPADLIQEEKFAI